MSLLQFFTVVSAMLVMLSTRSYIMIVLAGLMIALSGCGDSKSTVPVDNYAPALTEIPEEYSADFYEICVEQNLDRLWNEYIACEDNGGFDCSGQYIRYEGRLYGVWNEIYYTTTAQFRECTALFKITNIDDAGACLSIADQSFGVSLGRCNFGSIF